MATIEIRDILDNETGETIFPRTHVKAVIGLADSNFFEEYTDGNNVKSVRLRAEYAGLWADGFISAGGIGTGGGGGGGGLVNTVYTWTELQAMASAPLDDTDSVVNARSSYELYQLIKNTYTKAQVDQMIGAISSMTYEVVSSLPSASVSTMYKIYLVPSSDPQTQNIKDEFITIYDGGAYKWEQIGSTAIDLSGYVQTSRTINGHALTSDVTITASDVGLGSVTNLAASAYFTAMAMDGNDLSLTIGGTTKKLTVGYATIATKTRFTPSESGASQIEPLLDWFVPETFTESNVTKYRLRLNPKYVGLYADGWLATGGIGTGGGGGSANSITDLVDVDADNAVAGDLLVYTNGKWTSTAQSQIVPSVSVVNYGATLTAGQTITIGSVSGTNITVVVPSFALASSLSGYVPTSRKVNGHALTEDVSVTASDVGLGNVENTALSTWTGSSNITTLGTIASGSVPLSLITGADDLKAIEALTGTSGLLKKTAANTWSLDTTSYVPASRKINGVDLTADRTFYVGTTAIQSTSQAQALEGISSVKLSAAASLFEWDNDNSAWRFHGNLYADGWVAAGGVGSQGVTVVALDDLSDVSAPTPSTNDLLRYNGTAWVNVPQSSIVPSLSFSDLTSHPTTLAGYGITDAKIENGTITLGNQTLTPGEGTLTGITLNGSSVPVSNGVADLGTLISSVSNAGATLSAGQTTTIANVGGIAITVTTPSFVLASRKINGVDLTADRTLYLGTTTLQTASQAQALTGISSFKLSSNNSLVEWDSTNNAWHFKGNLYADGWVAAGGINDGSGVTYGVESITTNQDGTIDFHFTGGDITTVDLNHKHDGLLPDVTASDNGKIMKVVNGAWALSNESGGSGYELTSNKVTSLSSSSTDTQYPSAKCVYDIVGDVETLLAAL